MTPSRSPVAQLRLYRVESPVDVGELFADLGKGRGFALFSPAMGVDIGALPLPGHDQPLALQLDERSLRRANGHAEFAGDLLVRREGPPWLVRAVLDARPERIEDLPIRRPGVVGVEFVHISEITCWANRVNMVDEVDEVVEVGLAFPCRGFRTDRRQQRAHV